MELYIKAGPDGQSVGDCPFAHYVRALLETMGITYTVCPCSKDTKPDWLLEKAEGKMPCLRSGDVIVTDSSEIVEYLLVTFPCAQIRRSEDDSQILQLTSGFFPALARFIKKVDYDETLEKNLAVELSKLEAHLQTSPRTGFLCGRDSPTLCDLSLGPKLYHMVTTLNHFYPYRVEKVVGPGVLAYCERVLSLPQLESTSYPADVIIHGWTAARQ